MVTKYRAQHAFEHSCGINNLIEQLALSRVFMLPVRTYGTRRC
jgi:hypothetical protein